MKKIILIMFFVLIISSKSVCAFDTYEVLTDEMKEKIETSFENIDIDALKLIEKLNRGESFFDENILNVLKKHITDAFYDNIGFALRLSVIILIVAVTENLRFLKNDFSAVCVVCTCVVAAETVKIFCDVSSFAANTVDNIILFINSLTPILIYLIAGMGKIVTSNMLSPLMLGVSSFLSVFIKSFIFPLIFMSVSFCMCFHITGKEQIEKFGKFIASFVKRMSGFMLTLYIGVITIIGVSAPKIDDVTLKTAKYAVSNFVPFVGNMLSDSVDLVFNCSSVLKNSVGIAGLFAILSVAVFPCIKIGIKIVMLNIVSVFVLPVSQKNICGLISDINEFLSMLLGMVFVVMLMYILSVTVIIFIGGA